MLGCILSLRESIHPSARWGQNRPQAPSADGGKAAVLEAAVGVCFLLSPPVTAPAIWFGFDAGVQVLPA